MRYYIDLTEGDLSDTARVKIQFSYTSTGGDLIEGKQLHGSDAWEALELFSDDIFDRSILPPVDLNKPCTITLSKDGPS